MFIHNEPDDLKSSTNTNIHIINRSSGKNCSTSSTDSGVGLGDNGTPTFRAGPATREHRSNRCSTKDGDTKAEEKAEDAETEIPQHINVEVEAKVKLNKKLKSSPALSIRSTTISIVSIDENAIDSSCIDSDSEAEPDEGCTVQKLGKQVASSVPPNAELSQLNNGLTVISRQVMPATGNGPPPILPPDVVAQQLLSGNMSLATPTTPASAQQQIGSIALNNTTDVTFGDKHYYEGPVTIQQILIDSRDKWKAADGQDNPAFDPRTTPNASAPGDKLDASCEPPGLCPFNRSMISRKAVAITAAFVLLTIVLGVILVTTTNLFGKKLKTSKIGDGDDTRQNIPINSTIDQDNIGGGLILRYVPRAAWLAQPAQKSLPPLAQPVPMVVVLPTNSENCSTQAQCVFRVRFLQTFDIESQQRDDISFNFLIGGDGNVYVGRGWDQVGAHIPGWNTRSVSFAYIGTFQHQKPSPKQLNVTRLLLEDGVSEGKISPNYKLVGASSLEPTITEYNAEMLYKSFANWTHWTTA
ncbi:hypothetical protein KR222_006311 [Zaprionus bogoriensis]|nr:hypothetical protein KR222_006311 [Zaprionus bogoriensis]